MELVVEIRIDCQPFIARLSEVERMLVRVTDPIKDEPHAVLAACVSIETIAKHWQGLSFD